MDTDKLKGYQMKKEYFDESRSIQAYCRDDMAAVLKTISYRYIGENPPHPFGFHAYHTDGFRCLEDGRFDLNLDEKMPGSRLGSVSYIKTKFWKTAKGTQRVSISCYGPVSIRLHQEVIYRSSVEEEANCDRRKEVWITYQKGWNELIFQCEKTASGFGCIFGVQNPGWDWISFMATGGDRKGQLGFIYSIGEADGEGTIWKPDRAWPEEDKEKTPIMRIFGKEGYVYSWSTLWLYKEEEIQCKVEADLPVCLYIDGRLIIDMTGSSASRIVALSPGSHTVVARYHCLSDAEPAKYDINFSDHRGEQMPLSKPANVHGTDDCRLYIGPFPVPEKELERAPTLYGLFGEHNERYWKIDEPHTVIRPVLENERFARWNYPLGVTLYGLAEAAGRLEDRVILDYAARHVQECVALYKYSVWDKSQYGYPEINNQLISMGTLDDCGSFGSAMLALPHGDFSSEIKQVADVIAHHMRYVQERQADGAFYRKNKDRLNGNDTLWVDDLYMSVPFLCRYYKMTKQDEYLEDAVNQLIQFKKYLFLPEHHIMAHVYDLRHGTNTKMPWARGNGWCFFSLSELLEVMPENHVQFPLLVDFYNELAEGYIKLQGEHGLWHQLLTHKDSYEETSSTAMFLYGLCRGLRFGWFHETSRTRVFMAAKKGWEGLTKKSIDAAGNIHGICGGSSYSFSPRYYKEELLWLENDPHGIGIVLLAGVEWSYILTFPEGEIIMNI